MMILAAILPPVLISIPALILHECGHLAVALLCGVKVRTVGICITGLYTKRESGPRLANLLISFSGPLVNLLLAAALQSGLPAFARVNLIIGIFNLLPLPHSDGSRIIALLRQRSPRRTVRYVEAASPATQPLAATVSPAPHRLSQESCTSRRKSRALSRHWAGIRATESSRATSACSHGKTLMSDVRH